MKKQFFLFTLTAILLSCFGGGMIAAAFGVSPELPTLGMLAASFTKKAAGSLSMGLQREIWLPSLKEEYVRKPTWLDKADDLSSFVDQAQVLHFAEAGADPDVVKNATGDIDSVEPTETPSSVSLDTYDSENYKIRQATLAALPYDKISHYTRRSADAIRKKEALEAAYSFTPDAAGTKKIVLATTGGNDGNGLKMVQLDDIVRLATACDNEDFQEGDNIRNLVLTTDMWWQLVRNNDILKAQLQYQQNSGIIDPQVVNYYGINIHKYNHGVGYNLTTSAKAAQGAAYSSTIVPLGFMFCSNEVFRASGQFLMTYLPFSQNTKGRAHEIGFQHRFKSGFQRDGMKYSAMLYAAKVA